MRTTRPVAVLLAATGFAAAFLLWGEVVSARASARGVAPGGSGMARTVLVLGYGDRRTHPNAVNRWRIRAGLRTLRTPDDVLLLSGGAVHNPKPEACILAEEATRRGYRGPIRIEAESRSTEENIRNAIPFLEDAKQIAIVSNALHAERARGLLRAQRPDLGARLIRADDNRIGEIPVIKAIAAAFALVARGCVRPRRTGTGRAVTRRADTRRADTRRADTGRRQVSNPDPSAPAVRRGAAG